MNTPDDPQALLARGLALLEQGAVPAALGLLEPAAARFPDHAGLASALGDGLQMAGQLAAAEAAYRRALALDPTPFEAWYGLGSLHLTRWSYGAAEPALREALARAPGAAAARAALAEVLFQTGQAAGAIEEYRRLYGQGGPALDKLAFDNIATIIPGSPAADHAAVLAVRRAWAAALPAAPPRPAIRREGRLRIGYVSAFFAHANWMKPVFAVINRHDRDAFEVHLISDGEAPGAAAGYREHEADGIWKVRGMPNDALAARIAEAGIDVLIDLNGYSRHDRLGLFARRPAPVQLGWFNMFATTGCRGIDALIGDAAVIRAEEEGFYSERILRVPGSYLAFEVNYPVPAVAPPPCLASGVLTFGSLCSAIKLTEPVIAAWCAILRGAPAARLLLRAGTLEDASNQAALLARFAAEGGGGRADHPARPRAA